MLQLSEDGLPAEKIAEVIAVAADFGPSEGALSDHAGSDAAPDHRDPAETHGGQDHRQAARAAASCGEIVSLSGGANPGGSGTTRPNDPARPRPGWTQRIAGRRTQVPGEVVGPKVCLINNYSASDGDIFPFFFKKYGLGPLIGTRTWGGVRGIRGEWTMLDGGYITVPEDAQYGLQSEWVIENHGVDPDITVDTDPGQLLAGHDAQLETAVNYLMKKLQTQKGGLPPPPPPLPAYPPQGQIPGPSL